MSRPLAPLRPPDPADLLAGIAGPAPLEPVAPGAPVAVPIPIPIPGVMPASAEAGPMVSPEILGLPAQGDLTSLPLPRLLYALYVGTYSGTLTLERQNMRRVIHCVAGFPVRVDSRRLTESLARVLLDRQMIAYAQYVEAQARMQAEHCQMGDALVAMGALSVESLPAALRLQTELKLQNCLAWRDGSYLLEPIPPPPSAKVARIHPLPNLWAGVHAHYEAPALRAYFAPLADRFLVAQPAFRVHLLSLGSLLGPLNVAPLLNGETTLGQALGGEPGRFVQLAPALYVLLVTDMVVAAAMAAPDAAVPANLLG